MIVFNNILNFLQFIENLRKWAHKIYFGDIVNSLSKITEWEKR